MRSKYTLLTDSRWKSIEKLLTGKRKRKYCLRNIFNAVLWITQKPPFVNSLFGLIREAVARLAVRIDNDQPDKEELIGYIHQHVYDPHIIQVKKVAAHFHISRTCFNAYFKRKFRVSFRQYVREYRTSLIEQCILIPTVPINHIADEFGFADEAHLSNFFKSVRKVSPAAFRKAHLA